MSEIIFVSDYKKSLVKNIIKNIKYKGVRELIPIIAHNIYQSISAVSFNFRTKILFDQPKERIFLVPIPLHRRKYAERGFNQSILIAKDLAQYFGWQCKSKILYRCKYTVSQTNLLKAERASNVDGVFKTKLELDSRLTYVLIDDVITSGATLREAAQVLRQAGAKKIMAIVFASG